MEEIQSRANHHGRRRNQSQRSCPLHAPRCEIHSEQPRYGTPVPPASQPGTQNSRQFRKHTYYDVDIADDAPHLQILVSDGYHALTDSQRPGGRHVVGPPTHTSLGYHVRILGLILVGCEIQICDYWTYEVGDFWEDGPKGGYAGAGEGEKQEAVYGEFWRTGYAADL